MDRPRGAKTIFSENGGNKLKLRGAKTIFSNLEREVRGAIGDILRGAISDIFTARINILK